MVFSSSLFLFCFLPFFLLLYFIAPKAHKNKAALLGSLLFYFWGAPKFGFILLLAIFIDFKLVQLIHSSSAHLKRKRWLYCSLFINLGLLTYFKYANFFVENINALLGFLSISEMTWTKVILPIGISFFTFQKISYVLDVYFEKAKPLQKISDYALYILLFPQLIAGPIIRFNEIAEQIRDRSKALNIDNKLNGFFRFIIGMSKKLLIANPLGEQVDLVFGNSLSELGMCDAWMIIIAYALQIYYDFSGYSDMAIGIGLMLGFHFPENFNFPYIAQSITEFWRRWHITLSNWMRDYLYIPLGGNRKGIFRTYINLWLVFIVSGLWHGAAWTFLIWGIYHGCFLVLDRLFLKRVLKKSGKFPAMLITFFLTLIGWVFFRADDFGTSIEYISVLFSNTESSITFSKQFISIFLLGLSIAFSPGFLPLEDRLNSIFQKSTDRSIFIKSAGSVLLLIICMSEIEVSGFNPFIYFRF